LATGLGGISGAREMAAFELPGALLATRVLTGSSGVDTVQAWRKEYADPVEEMACGNVQPWGA
jgi:hypothetical protein